MILANVIFPALAAPWVSALLFPVAGLAALTSEVAVYKRLNRANPVHHLIALVVFVNFVSAVVGVLLSSVLPSGLTTKETSSGNSIITQGPDFEVLVLVGFVAAYILSILIEGLLLRFPLTKPGIERFWATSFWANTVSYVVLTAISLFWGYAVW